MNFKTDRINKNDKMSRYVYPKYKVYVFDNQLSTSTYAKQKI